MLLLLMLGASPITFVVDAPIEVDGQRIERRAELPRKASYRVRLGDDVVTLDRLELATEIVIRKGAIDVVEPAPGHLRLRRYRGERLVRYAVVDRRGSKLSAAEPALWVSGRRVDVQTAGTGSSIHFTFLDEGCFVDASPFRIEARVLAEEPKGVVRRVFSVSTEVVGASTPCQPTSDEERKPELGDFPLDHDLQK